MLYRLIICALCFVAIAAENNSASLPSPITHTSYNEAEAKFTSTEDAFVGQVRVAAPVTSTPIAIGTSVPVCIETAPFSGATISKTPISGAPVTGEVVTAAPISPGSKDCDRPSRASSSGPVTSVPVFIEATMIPDPNITNTPFSGVPISSAPISGAPVAGEAITTAPRSPGSKNGGKPPSVPFSSVPIGIGTSVPVFIETHFPDPNISSAPFSGLPISVPPFSDAPVTNGIISAAPVVVKPGKNDGGKPVNKTGGDSRSTGKTGSNTIPIGTYRGPVTSAPVVIRTSAPDSIQTIAGPKINSTASSGTPISNAPISESNVSNATTTMMNPPYTPTAHGRNNGKAGNKSKSKKGSKKAIKHKGANSKKMKKLGKESNHTNTN